MEKTLDFKEIRTLLFLFIFLLESVNFRLWISIVLKYFELLGLILLFLIGSLS